MQRTTRFRCSCARMCWSPPAWPTPLKSNQDSKLASELKTSGSRKLSRLHSSLRLFCSGVPARVAWPLSYMALHSPHHHAGRYKMCSSS